jgi:hypothetical protein
MPDASTKSGASKKDLRQIAGVKPELETRAYRLNRSLHGRESVSLPIPKSKSRVLMSGAGLGTTGDRRALLCTLSAYPPPADCSRFFLSASNTLWTEV